MSLVLGLASALGAFVLPLGSSGTQQGGRSGCRVRMRAGEKVVVTGAGVISAVGTGEDFWPNLIAGVSGVDEIKGFDASRFPTTIGAEVLDFDAKRWFDNPKNIKATDRYSHMAMGAARLAIAEAELPESALKSDRAAILVGTAFGGMDTFEKQVLNLNAGKKVSPFSIPALLANTAAGILAIELGCTGPNYGVVSACAAGTHALGDALRILKYGEAEVAIAGGSEAAMTPFSYAGFSAMKAMCSKYNDDPKTASRPFDAERAGFVMGEGAGMLVLETESHALARGANILCELGGYAATCDAHHITTPHPEGAGLAMCLERALADADVPLADVDYINAHGTSTAYNDRFETMAIKKVFGELSSKLAVSSTKSMTGHTLGAAGGIEAAICVKMMQTGDVPPTINYQTPDPECDLNYVPNKAIHIEEPTAAISDNLGFGGHNAALVFKAYSQSWSLHDTATLLYVSSLRRVWRPVPNITHMMRWRREILLGRRFYLGCAVSGAWGERCKVRWHLGKAQSESGRFTCYYMGCMKSVVTLT
eukprot:CAMPEP_0183333360 /NCGR_PEP_ID=MMETSP0164_2-20130417/2280_1 /TAXON_ID=221442 /ORGANISM="Coccolithus pelagicus ssp braarudi, Strain PLY182g" /LENGTH=536 /DNA_ID=CAMNT_0025502269 /DNA_START=13 /DNA_END=1621 /DNA_ORIENTATION=-